MKLLRLLVVVIILAANFGSVDVVRAANGTAQLTPPAHMKAFVSGVHYFFGYSVQYTEGAYSDFQTFTGSSDLHINGGDGAHAQHVTTYLGNRTNAPGTYDIIGQSNLVFELSDITGGFDTLTWDTGTIALYGTFIYPGGSFQVRFPEGGNGDVWEDANTFGLYEQLAVSVSGDSTPYVDESVVFTPSCTGGTAPITGHWEVYHGGTLDYNGGTVSGSQTLTYTFDTAGTYDVVFNAADSGTDTAHGHFWAEVYADALHCGLSGPSQWGVNVVASFTATGSGGVVHSGDSYDYRLGTQFGAGAIGWSSWGASGSLSKTFLALGSYTMYAEVRDSHGSVDQSSGVGVTVGDTVADGAYRWTACRRGVNGQFIDVVLYTVTDGAETELLGSAWSMNSVKVAETAPDGSVSHTVLGEGYFDLLTPGGGGRYFMRGTKAFSFEADLVHGAVTIPIVGAFFGPSGCAGGWNESDGTAINPETFPGEDATTLAWLQPIIDALRKLFELLFVPTEAQMRQLLPSGQMGLSLLEGTSWGTAGGTWEMHVHWGQHEVPLVNLDFADYTNAGFVVALRTAVQIGYVLALVYMVVVLL